MKIKVSKYLKKAFILVSVVLVTAVTGCTASDKSYTDNNVNSNKENIGYINIDKENRIKLPFITFEKENEYRQLLTANYKNTKKTLLCVLKLSDKGIILTGLTLSSMPLFTLKYEENTLDEKYYVPKAFLPPVNQVLFDIMLAFDDKNKLNKLLANKYIIKITDNCKFLRKTDGNEIYRIEYAPVDNILLPSKIINSEFSYSIDLKYLK